MAEFDFRKLASADGAAAAAFDPQTLLIHFPDPHGRATDAVTAWDLISEQPVSLLAHEFTHYFQMTSTTYGLKRMLMFLEGLVRKLGLLRDYVARTDGHVRGPIIERSIELARGDLQFGIALSHLIVLLSRERQQDGGWAVDVNELPPSVVEE